MGKLKNIFLEEWKSVFYITLGLILYGLAASAFQIPHKIVGGGATGLSTVIYYLSGEVVPVGLSFFIINLVLIVISFKILGPRFGSKTILATFVGSLMLGIFQPLFPVALLEDRFLSTVVAGMMMGAGIALALVSGGSTGGTDIVAMLVTKYRNVSPGKVLMVVDSAIIFSSLTINPTIEGLIYGFVLMGVTSYTVDFIFTGKKQSAQLFIFSSKYAEIADYISKELHRGVTVVDCHGWYSGENSKMLIIMVRKNEITDALKTAKRLDPRAFITMNTVMGVYGQGFEEVKGV